MSNDEKFEQAIAVIIYSWTALNLAVEHQWGGPDSDDKRAWVAGVIADMFRDRKNVSVDDLEMLLQQILSDEFDVALEDDSAFQISQDLRKLYDASSAGNYGYADALIKRWETQPTTQTHGRRLPNADGDDSSDEDASEEEDAEMMDHEPSEPVIDDDGFELVQHNNRRNLDRRR